MLVDIKAPFVAAEIPLPLNDYGVICYFTEHSSQTAGSACDAGINSKISALGEYLERDFLYHGVPSKGKCSVTELSKQELALLPFPASFQHFDYVTVEPLMASGTLRIPRSLISLNTSDDADTHFRDTSGCALGRDQAHARLSASLEFIERQSLIISWHTQSYQARLSHAEILDSCEGKKKKLFERFTRSGKVVMLLNTLPGVSCYSGVMLYRSGREVKYAVSSACALTLSGLVNKLVAEMWQSYLFIYNNLGADRAIERDYYKAHFLSMNQPETFELWGEDLSCLPTITPQKCPDYTPEAFYHSLSTLDARLYSYQEQTQDGFWFCKFLSPDFFPHMSAAHISGIPDYCRDAFNIHVLREIEIPFP
ncbi:YcaO-like family protein [Salinivibrio kushneri]|uniref:YcaO-like family protein n=1 Tax=Salinivibrio kushneri TaxID=1908198 RepID=UPI0009850703|nr:YcaO-like family protein [Salinivibrio kushneri]OOE46021.1 hypothetical protein BZG10_14095 [Salinivibrio kushneri]OOE51971.1 hypothetical protein BZG11_05715 [Salinivibrio kushneri]OOE59586.1 hypothetical protein BZG18_13110 [Salinivibrio kushneri]